MSQRALVDMGLLLATAATASAAGVAVWLRVRVPGARAMALLLFATAANCAVFAAEFATTSVAAKLGLEQALLVGWEVVPAIWFVFALQFTGRGRYVTPGLIGALCVVPVAGLVIALTNGAHHLFLTAYRLSAGDAHLALERDLGPAFVIHAVYAYALLAVGTVLLAGLIWQSRTLYRRQAVALLVAVLLPWATDVLLLSGTDPVAGADVQAVVVAVSALIMTYALTGLRVSDVLAVSRTRILESLNEAVTVLGEQGAVLYENPEAARLLDSLVPATDAAPAERRWPVEVRTLAAASGPDGVPGRGGRLVAGDATYDVRLSPVRDRTGWELAGILVARDVTDQVRAEEELRRSASRYADALDATVHALSTVVEVRDPYTVGHQRRVTALARLVAQEMGLGDDDVRGLCVAAEVHDIGKVQVPVEILSRPGRISATEFAVVAQHAEAGYEILKGIAFPWPVAETVLQLHEKLDGSGYPRGLRGDDISLEARILCVADVVEAMASDRPYRPALGTDVAIEEITAHRGTRFDADVVDACVRVLERLGGELPSE